MPGDFRLDYGQTELILYNKENKMNRFLIIGYMVLGATVLQAAPVTRVSVSRPTTTVSVSRPTTGSVSAKPTTAVQVKKPTTSVTVAKPETSAAANHPVTMPSVSRPATTVEVSRPTTQVSASRPTTGGETAVSKPGGADIGKKTAAPMAQAQTSMSNYQPKKAKDFKAAKPQQAAQLSGGESGLMPSSAEQAAKAAAAASMSIAKGKDPSAATAQTIQGQNSGAGSALLNLLKQKSAGNAAK